MADSKKPSTLAFYEAAGFEQSKTGSRSGGQRCGLSRDAWEARHRGSFHATDRRRISRRVQRR